MYKQAKLSRYKNAFYSRTDFFLNDQGGILLFFLEG